MIYIYDFVFMGNFLKAANIVNILLILYEMPCQDRSEQRYVELNLFKKGGKKEEKSNYVNTLKTFCHVVY